MNLHGNNPASTSSGPVTQPMDHRSTSEIMSVEPAPLQRISEIMGEHLRASANRERSALAAQARAVLSAAVRGEELVARQLQEFVVGVIQRDSLGALALRTLAAGEAGRRAAIELAGAVMALEAVESATTAAARSARKSPT